MFLFTTKPGFEHIAAQECLSYGIAVSRGAAPGMLEAEGALVSAPLCFTVWQLADAVRLEAQANSARNTEQVANWYSERIREERIDSAWPVVWLNGSANGFGPDARKAKSFVEQIKRRMARVARLGCVELPPVGKAMVGCFVVEAQGQLWVSRSAIFFGQRRMRDDPQAPSRSYLKVEEAFAVFGRAPGPAEKVADLGAAPGGWSFAAAKRGAEVWAIDNGALKDGAARHPKIHHVPADAYCWNPPRPLDWLLCDMVDRPDRVLSRVRTWLDNRWCRYAVVNLKFGYADPLEVLNCAPRLSMRKAPGLPPAAASRAYRYARGNWQPPYSWSTDGVNSLAHYRGLVRGRSYPLFSAPPRDSPVILGEIGHAAADP